VSRVPIDPEIRALVVTSSKKRGSATTVGYVGRHRVGLAVGGRERIDPAENEPPLEHADMSATGWLSTEAGGAVDQFNAAAVKGVKGLIDLLMADRAFARFYALETIARVPYFAYLSVLHLRETLGVWRHPELLELHFSEAWNELQHLRVMEDLGGDKLFSDRFFAQHVAFAYYWIVVVLYMLNPRIAYNLNRHVEEHARVTYQTFLDDESEWLKSQPVPSCAKEYWEARNLYMFQSFQTSAEGKQRRPELRSLYDVFCAIRDDEEQHALTMGALEEVHVSER